MPRIAYITRTFSPGSLAIIDRARTIGEEYKAMGYDLTLRQLYYQFVSRGWMANKQTEYKRLGSIVNDARLAGLIDWEHLVDRTRSMEQNAHWVDPAAAIEALLRQYANDKWTDQEFRPEVWVEKEALVGVVERVAKSNDIPYFACRGYASQSSQWEAAVRFIRHIENDQQPIILHLGDHDPSGIDMTRDITDRVNLFVRAHTGRKVKVLRLALNMDQVEQYNPPPNPAKETDSRHAGYSMEYGDESWELDALDPPVINALVQAAVDTLRDPDKWDAAVKAEATGRKLLRATSDRWDDVADMLAPDLDDEDEGDDDTSDQEAP